MEGVERMNTIVIRNPLQGQEDRREGMRRDPYTMEVDQRNKNCDNCRKFGHMAKHCRN